MEKRYPIKGIPVGLISIPNRSNLNFWGLCSLLSSSLQIWRLPMHRTPSLLQLLSLHPLAGLSGARLVVQRLMEVRKNIPLFFNESVFFLLNVEIYLASKTYRLWLVVHATPWSTKKGIEKGSQSYQIGLVFLKDSIALLKTSFLVLLFLRRALSLSLTHRLLLVRSRERSLNCCFTKPGVQQAVKVQIQLVNIEENSNWKKSVKEAQHNTSKLRSKVTQVTMLYANRFLNSLIRNNFKTHKLLDFARAEST